MHNSWIDSAERFSHTTFLHTKFARNWRHEPPGRTLLLPFQSVDNARLITTRRITSIMCTNEHINDVHSEAKRVSLFSPVFLSFLLPIYITIILLYEYMTRSSHVKGNSLMLCTCIASYVTSRALHTMSSSSTISVVYRGKRGDITPLFRSARSRSFMFDQKRIEGIYSMSEKKIAEKILCHRLL